MCGQEWVSSTIERMGPETFIDSMGKLKAMCAGAQLRVDVDALLSGSNLEDGVTALRQALASDGTEGDEGRKTLSLVPFCCHQAMRILRTKLGGPVACACAAALCASLVQLGYKESNFWSMPEQVKVREIATSIASTKFRAVLR